MIRLLPGKNLNDFIKSIPETPFEDIPSKPEKPAEIETKQVQDGKIEGNYTTIGYADVILSGKLEKKFISESPREDTVYEILKDSNGSIKIGVWKGAEKRVLNCPDFVDGCDKQKVAQKPVHLDVKLGDLQKNDGGGYIVTKIPTIKFTDKPEEKSEQPENQNAPKISELIVTPEEKTGEIVKESVETPVVESAGESKIENSDYEAKKNEIERRRQEELNKDWSLQSAIIEDAFRNNKDKFKRKGDHGTYEYEYPKEIAYDNTVFELGDTINGHFTVKNTKTGFETKGTHIYIYNMIDSPVFKVERKPTAQIINDINAKYDEELAELNKQFGKTEPEKLSENGKGEEGETEKKEAIKEAFNSFKNLIIEHNKLVNEMEEMEDKLQKLLLLREKELNENSKNEIEKKRTDY